MEWNEYCSLVCVNTFKSNLGILLAAARIIHLGGSPLWNSFIPPLNSCQPPFCGRSAVSVRLGLLVLTEAVSVLSVPGWFGGRSPARQRLRRNCTEAVTVFIGLNLTPVYFCEPPYTLGGPDPLQGSQALTLGPEAAKWDGRRAALAEPPGHGCVRIEAAAQPSSQPEAGGECPDARRRAPAPGAVPGHRCSPVGHLSELRPLEIGGQAPDLVPGSRHRRRAATRQRSPAGYGQRARTNSSPRSPSAVPPAERESHVRLWATT